MARSEQTIDLLLTRRSVKPMTMAAPGPDAAELEIILRAGARVPDHGKLVPWRFILFTEDVRAQFGKVLRKRFAEVEPAANEDRLVFEESRFLRAPLVVPESAGMGTASFCWCRVSEHARGRNGVWLCLDLADGMVRF